MSADCTIKDGIPCTTLAHTMLDLAEVDSPRGVERAIEQAEVLRLFDLRAAEESSPAPTAAAARSC